MYAIRSYYVVSYSKLKLFNNVTPPTHASKIHHFLMKKTLLSKKCPTIIVADCAIFYCINRNFV